MGKTQVNCFVSFYVEIHSFVLDIFVCLISVMLFCTDEQKRKKKKKLKTIHQTFASMIFALKSLRSVPYTMYILF